MDVASINSRLGQAASVDSRELDRVCEDIAAELIDANIEPPFRIPSADFDTDPWLICFSRHLGLLPVSLFGSSSRRSDGARSVGRLQQFSVMIG